MGKMPFCGIVQSGILAVVFGLCRRRRKDCRHGAGLRFPAEDRDAGTCPDARNWTQWEHDEDSMTCRKTATVLRRRITVLPFPH